MSTEKNVINMHLSQMATGVVKDTDYENDADNKIELGFKPAMVKGILLDSSDDPLHRFWWYNVEKDYTFTLEDTNDDTDAGSSPDTGFAREESDSFIEATENGFVLDGTEAAKVNGTPAGFIFEAYGCINEDAECPIDNEAHPSANDADTKLDSEDLSDGLPSIDGHSSPLD